MKKKTYSQAIDGKTFFVELNNWAEQANGSVLVRLGDTMVLGTAVVGKSPREGGDFFPLTVEYEEKFYATGKILGSRFMKRESRPSEEAVLTGRLIDRSIRPRFNMRMRNEVQVVLTVLSIDDQHDPDVPAMLAASLALSLSNIPWSGPIGSVRIASKDNELSSNPTYPERLENKAEIIISGTKDRINMIEAGSSEISEEDFIRAVEKGTNLIKELIAFQEEIVRENPQEKIAVPLLPLPEELQALLKNEFSARIESTIFSTSAKQEKKTSEAELKSEWMKRAAEIHPDKFQRNSAEFMFDDAINQIVHAHIIEKNERPDGRAHNELRAIRGAVGLLPRVHGSGMFMRGETHVLSTLTLGAPSDEQIVEGMEIRTKKHFLHHYNFPPFSVGEIKPMRGPGRREIGHGALAGRALLPLIPSRDEFPYTIRLVSEVLSSNGSSSMASVCGSSLALMDAGVPIKKLAAGAAMGLMLNKKGEYRVLTDIQGPEDHHGDMDFKVAGTRDGINAVQMDVKIEGITLAMLKDTLTQTYEARMKILDVMESVISAPRAELSKWAPRIHILKINPEKIGSLIGPGGKMINDIIAQTGAQIDIDDDGSVFITSTTPEGMEKALALVKQATKEIKAGELLEGKVTRVFEFGAMVEIGPRQDGLVHISELAPWRVGKVTDIVNIGDIIPVKVKNIDDQGRVNLSLKDVPGRYDEKTIEEHAHLGPSNSFSPRPQRGGGRRRDY